jgi:hypothetical protein
MFIPTYIFKSLEWPIQPFEEFFLIFRKFLRFLAPVRTNLAILREVGPNPNFLPNPLDFVSEPFPSPAQQTSPPIFGGPIINSN